MKAGKASLQRFHIARRAVDVTLCAFLLTAGFPTSQARAEQSGDAPCAERMRMFVLTIDGLFARRVRVLEAYYEAIREYLPSKGCTVEEVISISKRSKFSLPPFDESADYVIEFRDSDVNVSFGIEKNSGTINFPGASWNKVFP